MRRPPVFFALVLIGAVLVGCNSSSTMGGPQRGVVAQLVRVSGDSQSGVAGYMLDSPVVLRVVDGFGTGLPGVTVTFAIDPADPNFALPDGLNGALALSGSTAPTTSTLSDGGGLVNANWRLGGTLAAQHVKATVASAGTAPQVTLELTAVARTNAVRSIDGGPAGLCAIDLAGHLGCWQPPNLFRGVAATALPVRMKLASAPVTFTTVVMRGKEGGPPAGCALATTGTPWCFSVDAVGNVSGLAQLAGSYPAFTQLAGSGPDAGSFCALATDGSAWCWGGDNGGGLGDGTQTPQPTPVPVPTAARFTHLDVTDDEACGLTVDGKVWCWGDNFYGQVGAYNPTPGMVTPIGPTLVNTPVRFSQLALYAYGNMACGVATDGVYCWGNVAGFTTTPSTVFVDTTSVPRLMSAGSYFAVASGDPAFFFFGQGGSVQWSVTGAVCNHCQLVPWPFAPTFATILTTQGGGMICGGTTPSPTAPVLCMDTDFASDAHFADFPPTFGVPFP